MKGLSRYKGGVEGVKASVIRVQIQKHFRRLAVAVMQQLLTVNEQVGMRIKPVTFIHFNNLNVTSLSSSFSQIVIYFNSI